MKYQGHIRCLGQKCNEGGDNQAVDQREREGNPWNKQRGGDHFRNNVGVEGWQKKWG